MASRTSAAAAGAAEAGWQHPPQQPDGMALAAGLLGAALRCLPAMCRAWFAELRDVQRAQQLEAALAAFVSPGLIAAELQAASAAFASSAAAGGDSGSGGALTVRANRALREARARPAPR